MKAFLEAVRKSRKVQALIIALVALAAADTGFYFLRTAPASDREAALEDKVTALRQEVRTKDAEYRLYLSYDKGRAEVEAFKNRLSRRSEYTEILKKMYRLAKDDGMKSASFGMEKKEVQKEGDIFQLSFSMPIAGSYKDVRKFIYDVETSQLFLNIDSLALSKVSESDEISLSIGLSTYVRS